MRYDLHVFPQVIYKCRVAISHRPASLRGNVLFRKLKLIKLRKKIQIYASYLVKTYVSDS